MPNIVIDSSIPFVNGIFEPYAGVKYIEGKDITHEDLIDADALMVRTRTKCDQSLLEGTAVKLISSSAVGIDNIDTDYCRKAGIFVQNAAGSNAGGVMNYVLSALYGVAARKAIKLTGATLGIIGAGRVGTRVEKAAQLLGFKILCYDPQRAEQEGNGQFCELEDLLYNSDVITLHAPLNDDTRCMANEEFFSKMKPGTIFINTSSGDLVDEKALKNAVPNLGAVIIDVWHNEPNLDPDLVEMVDIATPHIAGYSYQGKQNGAAMAVRAVARFLGIQPLYDFFPPTDVKELEAVKLDINGRSQGQIASLFQYNYPIFTDDFLLRLDPSGFEKIRAEYQYRREFFID